MRLYLCLAAAALIAATPAAAQTAPKVDGAGIAAVPERPEETAAKNVVLTWFKMTFEQGKAAEAFPKYVSKDFTEHARRMHGNYASALAGLSKMPPRPGLDPKAAVDDEMVTVHSGIGTDIFRVVNGKITDHWDANLEN